ncbi:MAG: SDR family NAD(P)-dependent oxidoreductase [Deltaproteobacteria bacterium]|nr:SDR family NAD(P)-dependent oxidoreductase [Deltaproteobacteria bacterium]
MAARAQAGGLVAGKAALVTGAASGIGRATALALAREGAAVLVSDRDGEGAERVAAEIGGQGGRARAARCDVTRAGEVETMVRAALDAFGGRLDCAVNNAGITAPGGLVHDIDPADWERQLAVNLTGTFLCLRAELPVMRAQRAGSIVNVASGAGLIGAPGLAHYCASKHGLLGLTRTAALENAALGVRVNALCPGATDTPMLRAAMDRSEDTRRMILASLPSGRLGTPGEVAEAAVWLCSERASYVSGESLLVDGGALAR